MTPSSRLTMHQTLTDFIPTLATLIAETYIGEYEKKTLKSQVYF